MITLNDSIVRNVAYTEPVMAIRCEFHNCKFAFGLSAMGCTVIGSITNYAIIYDTTIEQSTIQTLQAAVKCDIKDTSIDLIGYGR